MFYSPQMLAYWLSDSVLYQHIGGVYPECTGGIVFLSKEQQALDSSCLYIGNADDVYYAADKLAKEKQPLIILCSGMNKDIEKLSLADEHSIICSNLNLTELYNRIQHHIHRYIAWESTLNQALCLNNGLQPLLDAAYTEINATILFLNAGNHLNAGIFHPDIKDVFCEELIKNRYMSFEAVKYVMRDIIKHGQSLQANEHVEYIASQSGLYTLIWNIKYNKFIVGWLVVVLPQQGASPIHTALCNVLVHYIREYLLNGRHLNYGGNEAFRSLAADLIDGHLRSENELNERLKKTPLAFHNYYHLLIVRFPDSNQIKNNMTEGNNICNKRTAIPWNYIIAQLEQMLPLSNITGYKDDIVILIKKNDYSSRLILKNASDIAHLLHYHGGYIMIGNCSKFLMSLSSMYIQTSDAFNIALKMNPDQDSRILYYEDYSIYQSIKMCAAGMKGIYGLTNLIYLCPPALISLIRYDIKYGTKLCNILKVYLKHDRNAADAARELYMHRNTVLYRMGKITEVLGQSLDDYVFRARLTHGFFVLEYVNKYLGEDILNLKPNRLHDNTYVK